MITVRLTVGLRIMDRVRLIGEFWACSCRDSWSDLGI